MKLREWNELFARLAPDWTIPEAVRVRHDWGKGTKFNGLGLFSTHLSGMELFGSSELEKPNAPSIAHWELLERTLTWEARGRILRPRRSTRFRYATSNGVALHTDRKQAQNRARYELLERDRILRSWYGYLRPELLVSPSASELRAPPEYTWWEARFPSGGHGVEVAVTLGVPCRASLPVTLGFGAADTLKEALKKSRREARQRLGFLWGLRVPQCSDPLHSDPSPLLHQDFYSHRRNQDLLLRWLYEGNPPALRCAPDEPRNVRFQDLTPLRAEGNVSLIRAHADGFIPLTFGIWSQLRPNLRENPRALHPLA